MNVYCIKCNNRLMVNQGSNTFTCMKCEGMVKIERTYDDLSPLDKVAYNVWKDDDDWVDELNE